MSEVSISCARAITPSRTEVELFGRERLARGRRPGRLAATSSSPTSAPTSPPSRAPAARIRATRPAACTSSASSRWPRTRSPEADSAVPFVAIRASTDRNATNGVDAEWARMQPGPDGDEETVMGATFTSVNPARPAEILGTYPESTAADVDAAVARATEAQQEWARVPAPARAEVIDRCGAILAERKAEFSTLVVTRGRARSSSRRAATCRKPSTWPHYVAGHGPRRVGRDDAVASCPNKMGWTTRQPVGVVGMITPWNFPVAIPSWKCFPALLAGNGIVLKPSEHAPQCCGRVRRGAAARPGVPEDLVNVVHGHGEPGAGARRAPGRPRGELHRLGADRPRRRRRRRWRPDRGSCQPRARRQERDDRAARRRPRARGRRRAVRRVRHRGPALHVDVAARSCTATSPTSSSTRSPSAPRRSCSATRSSPAPTSAR